MKGFIVYPDYTNIEDQTYICLYGRLENNESFVTITKFNPYFYVKEEYTKKIKKTFEGYNVKLEKTKYINFKGERVIKLIFKNQTELNKLKTEIHDLEIETYEADLKPPIRFMIDKNLLGTLDIQGDYESSTKVNRIYREPELSPADYKPKLNIVSLDIESSKENNNLLCLSLYSEDYKKCFMVTEKTNIKNTFSCKTEEECLEKFKQELINLDPDIITGWNVIDFDLFYLRELFKKHKIGFDIGRSNELPRIRIEDNFFRSSSADIPGRLVLDGLNLIRDPFIKEAPSIKTKSFSSYTLETVSQEILGKGKMLKSKNRQKEIDELYKKDQQKLADYNLLDAELVYEILKETDIINLSIERSMLTGMPLDRITATIASFDSLYIREANMRSLVSPTTRFLEKEKKNIGGYVMQPQPGMYNNVLVLDFKSLYPSIIRTFNIDPSSYIEKPIKNCITAPNNAYFKNQQGILPEIIKKLAQAREKAKKERRELANYAIKTIMNSFWGAVASQNSRYFDLKMSNAITSFAQEIIKLTARQIEDKGYRVIYSDTDSVFVNTLLEKEKAEKLGKEIEREINNFYSKYVKEKYNRDSFLELEYEKLYSSLIMPKLRKEETGAKKRYAGLIEKEGKETVEITGLEAIRGDWTQAAQEFQRKLLDKVFHKQNPIPFIKEYIESIRKGKLNDKLIYTKSIRKELKEYTKTTPPHVKAARKLDKIESNIIRYYITTNGPEPIQKLQHSLDYEHYIEKQIKPIAKTILDLLNIDFEEITKGGKQQTLF